MYTYHTFPIICDHQLYVDYIVSLSSSLGTFGAREGINNNDNDNYYYHYYNDDNNNNNSNSKTNNNNSM